MYYRNFLLLFFIASKVYSQSTDIDKLLTQYQSESELSKKTKKENAGTVLVFTRDEIERMQAETLKDVLKSVNIFRFAKNRLGEPDPVNIDPFIHNSKSVRVYLNDTELTQPLYGSGIAMFGNIELDFIDHIEVYNGFPSFEFGIEPANIVIRLYTKSAKHDEGSRVKFLLGSHGTNKENVYTSSQSDNLSYYIYANRSENKGKKYTVESQSIGSDTNENHFYGSLGYQKHTFEFHALDKKQEALLGALPHGVPYDSKYKKHYISASYSYKSIEDLFSFDLSYISEMANFQQHYTATLPPVRNFLTLADKYDTDTVTAILKKKIKYENYDITMGTQYRHKNFDFSNIAMDGIDSGYGQQYSSEDIFSLFLEGSVQLSQNHLVSLSAMVQHYHRDKNVKDETPIQLKFAYIYAQNNWIAKTFLTSQQFIPEPYMSTMTDANSLKVEKYNFVTQEIKYEDAIKEAKLFVGYGNAKNLLIPDGLGGTQNASEESYVVLSSLALSYKFRQKDIIHFQADYFKTKLPYTTTTDNTFNHLNYRVRMLNSIQKFDIFNEIVVSTGYKDATGTKKTAPGYDYSLGVKYNATKDLHIGVKGENIFNKGLKQNFIVTTFPTLHTYDIPIIEQKFLLSIEYLF